MAFRSVRIWRPSLKSRMIHFQTKIQVESAGLNSPVVMDDLKKFSRYFAPYKFALATGIACILAYVICSLYIPLIVGKAVDANWTEVNWTCLLYTSPSPRDS